MYNDRYMGLLGAGAILAVLCLLLPLPFFIRVAAGILVLVGFMVLALLRLGPDRITLEEWLKRRIRYQLATHCFVYQQPDYQPPELRPVPPAPLKPVHQPETPLSAGLLPAHFALDEVGVYPLLTAFLAVISVYFIVWLSQGGGEELAWMIDLFIGGK